MHQCTKEHWIAAITYRWGKTKSTDALFDKVCVFGSVIDDELYDAAVSLMAISNSFEDFDRLLTAFLIGYHGLSTR